MRCLGRLLPAVRSGLVHARSTSTTHSAMPRVAVVGGGLAGLMCAQELQSAGVAVHVFDMGKRGPGQLLTPLSCLSTCLRGCAAGTVFQCMAIGRGLIRPEAVRTGPQRQD